MGIILPKLSEWIPMMVAFLVLLTVLGKFGWPAIIKVLDDREKAIANSIAEAENAKIEGERLLEEYRAQLNSARADVARIVEEGKAAGEAIRKDIIAKAEAEALAMAERAKENVAAEQRAAMAELQTSIASISVEVAGKLIGEKLSADADAALINRFVAEVGGLNDN